MLPDSMAVAGPVGPRLQQAGAQFSRARLHWAQRSDCSLPAAL